MESDTSLFPDETWKMKEYDVEKLNIEVLKKSSGLEEVEHWVDLGGKVFGLFFCVAYAIYVYIFWANCYNSPALLQGDFI